MFLLLFAFCLRVGGMFCFAEAAMNGCFCYIVNKYPVYCSMLLSFHWIWMCFIWIFNILLAMFLLSSAFCLRVDRMFCFLEAAMNGLFCYIVNKYKCIRLCYWVLVCFTRVFNIRRMVNTYIRYFPHRLTWNHFRNIHSNHNFLISPHFIFPQIFPNHNSFQGF